MAPQSSCQGKEKATAGAKMPTSVINRRLSLDQGRIKGFILQHILRLRQIYNVCSVKDERAWDLFYDIIFCDPVTTCQFSQLQLMWQNRRSRGLHFREWWAAFSSYMGQMFDKTDDQMNNWRWDNPCAFGYHVNHTNLQMTSSGKVKRNGEHFSWYSSDDLRAQIKRPSCRLYKPSDSLAVRLLNWDEIINKEDGDQNWPDPRVPSGGRNHPGNGNDNEDSKGEEDTQSGEKGTGKGKGTKNWKGKGRRLRTERVKERGRGRGRVTVKGKVLLNKP